jgi:helix-turn-helix protein
MPTHSVVRLDRYVIEVLMCDLVGHDQQPSAFLVYLFLHARSGESSRRILVSLRDIAEETGLSKSAVQTAIFTLRRRKLIQRHARSKGMTSSYEIFRPWRKRRRYGGHLVRR